jgi:hypothetical protein
MKPAVRQPTPDTPLGSRNFEENMEKKMLDIDT